MATADPGAGYIALLSRVLRSKRRVIIHFLCASCLDARKVYSPEEEMKVMREIQSERSEAILQKSGKRKAWTSREWQIWLSRAEYEQMKEDFRDHGEVRLYLKVNTTLY